MQLLGRQVQRQFVEHHGIAYAVARDLANDLVQPRGIKIEHVVTPAPILDRIARMHFARRYQYHVAGDQRPPRPRTLKNTHPAVNRPKRQSRMGMRRIAGAAIARAPTLDKGQGRRTPEVVRRMHHDRSIPPVRRRPNRLTQRRAGRRGRTEARIPANANSCYSSPCVPPAGSGCCPAGGFVFAVPVARTCDDGPAAEPRFP